MHESFTIDRVSGTITTRQKPFLFSKKRSCSAEDVLSVRLLKKVVAVEDGYETLCYSILLEGRGESLELLCAEDEREAVSRYHELNEFLETYRRQRGPADSATGQTISEEEQ
jgi:hypothetical protein